MNALQIVQQVCDELALERPSALVTSSELDVRQMLALLNRLGSDLCTQYKWQRLSKEHILTTVAYTLTGTTTQGSNVITGISSTANLSNRFGILGVGIEPFAQIVTVDSATQVTMNMAATASGTVDLTFSQVEYPLPSDWQHQIPQTEWDRTNRWPLIGPETPQDWQSFKSGIVYAGPRERFRILDQSIAINPPPPNGLNFSFEYVSNGWVSSGGSYFSSIQTDADTFIFRDSLLVTGLKTQWKAAKGLDASFDIGEFRTMLESSKSQDQSAPKLSLSPYGGTVLLSLDNIPDGNWGL